MRGTIRELIKTIRHWTKNILTRSSAILISFFILDLIYSVTPIWICWLSTLSHAHPCGSRTYFRPWSTARRVPAGQKMCVHGPVSRQAERFFSFSNLQRRIPPLLFIVLWHSETCKTEVSSLCFTLRLSRWRRAFIVLRILYQTLLVHYNDNMPDANAQYDWCVICQLEKISDRSLRHTNHTVVFVKLL